MEFLLGPAGEQAPGPGRIFHRIQSLFHRRLAIFLVVSVAFGLALFERMSLAAIAKDLMAEFHLNASQMGTLGSVYFYLYAFLQIPVGMVVDRWSSRLMICISLGIAAVGTILFALAPNFGLLAAGRALVGVGFAGLYIPTLKLLAVWFPMRDLGVWNGLYLAIAYTGIVLAGRPLVELSQRVRWSGAMLTVGVVVAVMAAVAWLVIRDQPASGTAVRPAANAGRPDFRRAVRSPMLWLCCLAGFLLAGTNSSFQAIWAGPYLRDVYQYTPAVAGNLLMLIPVGQALGNFAVGWLADRVIHSRTAASIAGESLCVLLWLPMAFLTDRIAGPMPAIYVTLGFTYGAFTLLYPLLRERFDSSVANTSIGIFNLTSMLGGAVLQQVYGILLDLFTPLNGAYPVAAYQLAFQVSLASVILGVLLLAMGLLWGRGALRRSGRISSAV